jgi:hypothetical protein
VLYVNRHGKEIWRVKHIFLNEKCRHTRHVTAQGWLIGGQMWTGIPSMLIT